MIRFVFKVIELCLFEVIDQRSCETDSVKLILVQRLLEFAFWQRFRFISMMIFMGAKLSPKIKFLLQWVKCCIAELGFLSSNQTSLNRFKSYAAESTFIHLLFRFVEPGVVRGICICINRLLSQWIEIFLSSCLSGLSFFKLFCVFQRSFLPRFIVLQNETSVAIVRFYFFFWWSWLVSNIIFIRYYEI